MLDCAPSALGRVERVELYGTVLGVYSERHTARRPVLWRCPTYIESYLDMLCWHGAPPPGALDSISGKRELFARIDRAPAWDRHDFRVPDRFQDLAVTLYTGDWKRRERASEVLDAHAGESLDGWFRWFLDAEPLAKKFFNALVDEMRQPLTGIDDTKDLFAP